jgi:hypothetical protein
MRAIQIRPPPTKLGLFNRFNISELTPPSH